MVLFHFSLRAILHRPGRTTLTLLSIVIGVAILVSVAIATSTTRVAYRDMFAAVSGRAALEVVAEGGGPFDENVLTLARETPGVKTAVPVIQRISRGYAGERKATLLVLGIDPNVDSGVRDLGLAEGQLLLNEDGVLLEGDLARGLGVGADDELGLLTRRGMQKLRVMGLVRSQLHMASLAYMRLETAQELFGMASAINAIQVVLEDGANEETVRADIARRLPVGISVRPPATRTQIAEETMLSAETGLKMATGFSLLLATFIILNTFLMSVGERRRQLSIMRAIGATRSQISRLIYLESLGIASVGVVLGILLGLGGGHLLILSVSRLLLVPLPPAHISWLTILLAALFGLGIAVLGAAVPARRAAKLSPLEGMSVTIAGEMASPSHKSAIVGILTILVSGLLLVAYFRGWLPTEVAVATCVLLLSGMVLLLPSSLGVLSRFGVRLLTPLARVEAHLAHRQILRHRVRSALTVGVLFVASASGVGMAGAILDSMGDVATWYHRVIVGDFFIRAMLPDMSGGPSAGVPKGADDEVREVPGVRWVGTTTFVPANAAGAPVMAVVREFADDEPLHLDLKTGNEDTLRQELREGQVVIGTVLAQRTGLTTGDELELKTRQGARTLRIAGTANDYLFGGLTVCLQRKVAEAWFKTDDVSALAIRLDDETLADPEALADVRQRLSAICQRYGVMLESRAELTRMIDGMVAGVNGCLLGILVLGFVVAAFGTVNTLTMNVLEQTRELGLLRIVAMTRWQVRRTILSQAGIIAALGLVPGTCAGIAVSYLISAGTVPATGHPIEFQFHPVLLAVSLAASVSVVLISAWLPAERAARLDLLTTLQYE